MLRVWTRKLTGGAVVLALLVFASAAIAEMPRFAPAPTLHHDGTPAVGEELRGDKGNLLYDDGTACQAECRLTFEWWRLNGSTWTLLRSSPASEPAARYVIEPADAGGELMFKVRAVKFDCGAHNSVTGEMECRDVHREADSNRTPPVLAPAPPPPPPPPPAVVPPRVRELEHLRGELERWRENGVTEERVRATRIWRACMELRLATERVC